MYEKNFVKNFFVAYKVKTYKLTKPTYHFFQSFNIFICATFTLEGRR